MNSTDTALEPTVFVVDDDEAVCDALGMLLRASGMRVETFNSAQAFLNVYRHNASAACSSTSACQA